MKQMVMTGLATEHDFESGEGEVQYVLLFNKGELRVPITKESAEKIIEHAYSKPKQQAAPVPAPIVVPEEPYVGEVFGGSDEADDPPPAESFVGDNNDVVDEEDGTPQV